MLTIMLQTKGILCKTFVQVFEERRNLLGKWVRYALYCTQMPFVHLTSLLSLFMLSFFACLAQFEKWTDSQRKQVLQDFFSRCSAGQLKHLRQTLSSWVPEETLDFTTVLPRVISLYIFSFLDPRSLCRCAQVSKYHRNKTALLAF